MTWAQDHLSTIPHLKNLLTRTSYLGFTTFSNTALVRLALDRLRVERHLLLLEAKWKRSFYPFFLLLLFHLQCTLLCTIIIDTNRILNNGCLRLLQSNVFKPLLGSYPLPYQHFSHLMTLTVNVLKRSLPYDAFMIFWTTITQIFFREIRPRGAFNIPRDGPVIFVGAPHNNQVLLALFCERLSFNKHLDVVPRPSSSQPRGVQRDPSSCPVPRRSEEHGEESCGFFCATHG